MPGIKKFDIPEPRERIVREVPREEEEVYDIDDVGNRLVPSGIRPREVQPTSTIEKWVLWVVRAKTWHNNAQKAAWNRLYKKYPEGWLTYRGSQGHGKPWSRAFMLKMLADHGRYIEWANRRLSQLEDVGYANSEEYIRIEEAIGD